MFKAKYMYFLAFLLNKREKKTRKNTQYFQKTDRYFLKCNIKKPCYSYTVPKKIKKCKANFDFSKRVHGSTANFQYMWLFIEKKCMDNN